LKKVGGKIEENLFFFLSSFLLSLGNMGEGHQLINLRAHVCRIT